MNADLIISLAAIGSVIEWSDGSPSPPEHHVATHSKRNNASSRLVRKCGERGLDCPGGNFILGCRSLLSRMEEARRQTQHQLDIIDRQIIRRMTATIPHLHRRRRSYRRGRPPEPCASLTRYRANLAAITAERQQEIDALSRKLAREDRVIAALRERPGGRKPP
jgi:hypothetical protein